jgi:5-(carboxyamino)imidazole ribonucleotide synthase
VDTKPSNICSVHLLPMNLPCDIAIVGGGQLGKMLIEEGLRYNLKFATLDPEAASPAALCSHHHIQGSLHDASKIAELGEYAQTITYEIENVNTAALATLEMEGKRVVPSSAVLAMIQDKGLQKDFYTKHNIPTAPYCIVQTKTEWTEALRQNQFDQFAAKLCTGGYDGKGVTLMRAQDIYDDVVQIPYNGPVLLEKFVDCVKEISIIVARNAQGEVKCFPPVEMQFDPIANLVTYLICPAEVSGEVLASANTIATKCVQCCEGEGIFAIEMFVTAEGSVLVNEMAPRPHNSGHHTIEGCYTSQYEQLLRVLTNKPLGSTEIVQPSAMLNILGSEVFEGPYKLKYEAELLATPGVYIHMYNKSISKPNRKLGHITILAPTLAELNIKANTILHQCEVIPS